MVNKKLIRYVVILLINGFWLTSHADPKAAMMADNASFAHIERLDRTMDETNKEIAALNKAYQLKKLQKEASKLKINFVVLRIYGLDSDLKVDVAFDSGIVKTVRVNEQIEKNYTLSSINAGSAIAYNKENKTNFTIPFK